MRRMGRHLSYANVTATLALVLAMSGGAIAAKHYLLTSTAQIKPEVIRSLEAKDRSIFRKLARSVTIANATSAATATTAATAATASSATSAANADALGGIPASGFTHSDCASQTGQIKGFALVPNTSSAGLANAYNCSGQPVEVTLIEKLGYIVTFRGNPATIAIATPIIIGTEKVPAVGVKNLGPGEFEVVVSETKVEEHRGGEFELL